MRKLPLVLCLVLAAALVIVWSMDQRTKAELQQQSAALRQAQADLEDLRAENAKLRNSDASAGAGQEHLIELLRLRSEVTRLRQQSNEISSLRIQNQQLAQSRTASAPAKSPTTNTPPDVPPQDIHPRESWAFAGYANPDATVQSMLWGVSHTNMEAFLAGFAPEMRAEVEQHLPTEEQGFADKMANTTGFRVVDRKVVSEDEMDVTLYIDGEGNQETTRFKRIDGEWKVVK